MWETALGWAVEMGLVTTYGVHANLLQSCLTVTGLEPARLLLSMGSSGRNTGVGCNAILKRILPTH